MIRTCYCKRDSDVSRTYQRSARYPRTLGRFSFLLFVSDFSPMFLLLDYVV